MDSANKIILSIVITFIMYSIIPIIIALGTGRYTTKKRYRGKCFGWNLIIVAINIYLQFSSDVSFSSYSLAPYLLWTGIAYWIGSGIIESKHRLFVPDSEKIILYCTNCDATISDDKDAAKLAHHCKNCHTKMLVTGLPLSVWSQLAESERHALQSSWKKNDIKGALSESYIMISRHVSLFTQSDDSNSTVYFCNKCESTKNITGAEKNRLCPKCGFEMSNTGVPITCWSSLSDYEQKAVLEKWKEYRFREAQLEIAKLLQERKDFSCVDENKGAPLDQKKERTSSSSVTDRIICPTCGKELMPDFKFCNRCGRSMQIVQGEADIIQSSKDKDTNVELVESADAASANFRLNLGHLSPALRRAYIFIEDEEWSQADEYLKKILDEDPENAYAYLGKALVEAKVDSPDNIQYEDISRLQENRFFWRACKYADEELAEILKKWIN